MWRSSTLASLLLVCVVACGSPRPAPAVRPTDAEPDAELRVGPFEPDGDELVLSAQAGMCGDGAPQAGGTGARVATYRVVISKIGIRFTKLSDSCERRAMFDGQTWWRSEWIE